MRNKGFTLIELVIVVAVLGILALLAMQLLNPKPEAELVACAANANAMRTLVEQTAEQTFPNTPTWEQIQFVAGNKWNSHYHYVWDEPDPNSGHGNDLDFCDEDNPSGSTNHVGGECYDIRWVIVCDHDHGNADAAYVAVVGSPTFPGTPHVFGGDPDHKFVKDLEFWEGKDPNFQKWIGR
jgi:prepilin-type N-terminal cleavage/methylation domain-containing protein